MIVIVEVIESTKSFSQTGDCVKYRSLLSWLLPNVFVVGFPSVIGYTPESYLKVHC